MSMTSKRMLAHERRMASIHEAGHIVVARALGIRKAGGMIWYDQAKSEYDKSWIGCAWLTRHIDSLSQIRRCMIGVAGAVAENAWEYPTDDICLEDLFYDPYVMSNSDWRLANADPGVPTWKLINAAEKALVRLDRETGDLWKPLLSTSRELLIGSRHTHFTDDRINI